MADKIFIVEDDQATADLVKDTLIQKGYKVSTFISAEQALKSVRENPPEMLVLDIALPGFSGLQLCEMIRKESKSRWIPILMLTSQSKEFEKVHGLEAGADDYMTKPFSVRELTARVQALLRRQGIEKPLTRSLEGGGIVMNLESHEVRVRGKKVELRPKEYALLELLLKRKDQVLSHAVIAESVWGDERIVTSMNIKWWVHQLRGKLGTAGERIEAIPQLGYKFTEE